MHPSILNLFNAGLLLPDEVRGRTVLEVGSYDVNGTVRPIIAQLDPATYLGVDGQAGPGVDRVVNCVDLAETFGLGSYDVVVTTEMLEHVADWRRCVGNLAAVVAEGGVLVITTRSPGFPYHAYPDDYWRFPVPTMQAILEAVGLDVRECFADPDPESPGVITKARKPVGWTLPDESVLYAREVQPERAPSRPLTILGYPHQGDGSTYYRFQLPFQQLAHASRHAVMLPGPGAPPYAPQDDELASLDVLVGQRFMGPGLDLWSKWQGKTHLVYETDDDILHPDPSNGLGHLWQPSVQESAKRCIAMADLVTVSTEPLADVMRVYNPNVKILPNHIHTDLLTIDPQHRDRLTIGWQGGMSHLRDWCEIMDPFRVVLDAHPEVDMHFCGFDYSPLLKRVCRFTPWEQDVWTYYKSVDFDIGICPLADTVFNRSKSHLKALEYMALGIPVVASDVPAYRDLVVDGVTGYLVSSEGEWRLRLEELIGDEEARREMGAAGRKVAAGWTIQNGWRLWRDAYQEVAGWTP